MRHPATCFGSTSESITSLFWQSPPCDNNLKERLFLIKLNKYFSEWAKSFSYATEFSARLQGPCHGDIKNPCSLLTHGCPKAVPWGTDPCSQPSRLVPRARPRNGAALSSPWPPAETPGTRELPAPQTGTTGCPQGPVLSIKGFSSRPVHRHSAQAPEFCSIKALKKPFLNGWHVVGAGVTKRLPPPLNPSSLVPAGSTVSRRMASYPACQEAPTAARTLSRWMSGLLGGAV